MSEQEPTIDTATQQKVLFLGLGAMGTPMAACLASQGHTLLLSDLDRARAQAVAADLGPTATAVADTRAATETADVVVLMLPDTPAVEAVLLGDDGLLSQLRSGSVVIDMGSSQPASTVQLAATAAARGIRLIDAPVSGGVARARTGELAIMVGGPDDTVAELTPLLSAMGTITHVGTAGAGHALKALNNLLGAIGLTAAAEVFAVGEKFGLDPNVMLDVVNRSTGRNHATEVKFDTFVLSRAFNSGFPLRLMLKDLRTALSVAATTDTPTPLAAACLQEWMAADNALQASADHTEIAAYVQSRAGIS